MRVVEPIVNPRGSLRWLRIAVNDHTEYLNRQVRKSCAIGEAEIHWRSPLAEDEFAEYRDKGFLDLLDVELKDRSLESFWPKLGPQWDALATTADRQILLVEAKANIPEVTSPGTAARPRTRGLIEASLKETQASLGIDPSISWSGTYYQIANRLAHLYLLRSLNKLNAHLIFIYFVGAEDVNGPRSIEEWQTALNEAKTQLGLTIPHGLSPFVRDVYIDLAEMQRTPTRSIF